jgi:hypothetical protein
VTKEDLVMKPFSKAVPGVLVALAFLLSRPSFAGEGGPNLINNSSFEGVYYYSLPAGGPFALVTDPANARTGVRSLEVKIQPTGSFSTKYPIFVWPNTSYTTSVWYKGKGTLQLQVLRHDGTLELGHVDFTAAGETWKEARITYKTRNFYAIKVAINEVGGGGTVVYLDDLYTGLTDGRTIDFEPKKLDPKKPAANGFKLLWSDEFDDPNSIDVQTTKGDGFKWYTHRFYGFPNTTPAMYSMHDGVLTLTDCPTAFSEALATAAPFDNKDGYVGTVFRASAPIYFESRYRIHNWERTGSTKCSVSFWSGDMAMHVGVNKEMLGHRDHDEMIENDFVEMAHSWGEEGRHVSGIGDWCEGGSVGDICMQSPPVGYDYGQYHTYGCLLVPATAENGWNGYRTIYLDGVPMISSCWVGNQTYHGVFPETYETFGNYRFSATDRAWEAIIIGTCQGGVAPTDYDYVRVYGVSESSVKVVKAGPPTRLDALKDLSVLAGNGQVKVVWPATSRFYNVYRGTSPGGEDAKPVGSWVGDHFFTDKGLTNGTRYYYKVTALNLTGESEKSPEVSATPGPDGPNLLSDPSFEEGGKGWTIRKPFALTQGAANVHSGSSGLVIAMPQDPSGATVLQKVAVAKNTNYAAGFWMKGQGRLRIQVLDETQREASPLAILNAVSTTESWTWLWKVESKKPETLWQRMDLPVFNSGDNTSVYLVISDDLGGGGEVSLDDFSLHALAPGVK